MIVQLFRARRAAALFFVLGLLTAGCADVDNPKHDFDGDGATEDEGDCDDNNPAVFPSSVEIVCDGVDQDCDGADLVDRDGDGVSGCPGDSPFDCDDEDDTLFPGNPEVCNGADEDCDGVADNGLLAFDWWIDGDGDGFGAGTITTTCEDAAPSDDHVSADSPAEEDCDDDLAAINPDAPETCDGEDEDCDGIADNGLGDNSWWPDLDGDGVGDEEGAITSCSATAPVDHIAPTPGTTDCDDDDANNFPGNTETCDAADEDCDAIADNGFDGDSDTVTTCGPDGDAATVADNDCDDSDPANFPGNTEVCDGADNDCDGEADEGNDGDSDGFTVCGADGLPNSGDEDCDDGDGATYPGAPEICDAVDNDCDTVIPADETDTDGDTYIACVVAGGITLPSPLLGGGDCAEGAIAINPGATEVCSGADDNCDSVLFVGGSGETETDEDEDDYLACAGFVDLGIGLLGGDDCDDTVSTGAGVFPGAVEVCDGIDQDCDTDVDEDFDVDVDGWFDEADAGCVSTYPDTDCDDGSDLVNPDAPELCDGVDNDCDTLIDAADAADFVGSDGDSDGDAGTSCGGTDCDDTDPALNGLDADADGESTCDGDCDDTSPLFHTGAAEACDGEDNDCDGSPDNPVVPDADGDGFIATGCGLAGDDCDDTDPHVFPDLTYTSGWQRECKPALKPGFFGHWAHARLNLPSYFLDPQTGTHYLYFRGHHDPTFHQIGYAISANGVDWGPIRGPIFSENPTSPTWDGRRISHPSVAYVPGKVNGYVMAYHAQHDSTTDRFIGIATANTAAGNDTNADTVADAPFARVDLGGAAVTAPVVVTSAPVTAGDNERTLNPSLWYEAGTALLHMWYTGRYGAANEFVILHAACDTAISGCGSASDWIKTDSDSNGDPDIWIDSLPGDWAADDVQQTFVMSHSDPGGFFDYELEVWYTGAGTSIGYLQGAIDDASTWTMYASNPVFTPTTATDRMDSQSTTGRGVRFASSATVGVPDAYHMYYGTSVVLPEDGNGEGTDPLWGVGNFSDGASYIGHALNNVTELSGVSASCVEVTGTVTDNAPDTVEIELFDDGVSIAGPVTGNSTGNSDIAIQSTTFTIGAVLAAGAHDLTVVATDAGGSQRSIDVSVTCP